MQIRKYRSDEWEQNLISVTAFHIRLDDLEQAKRSWLNENRGDDWGALTEDGTPMARLINFRAPARFDGGTLVNGCIGAVSTLPEHRRRGAVRAIFEAMLRHNRAEGEVISTLYPFSHAFYRKFGYETCPYAVRYDLPVSALEGHTHAGWTRLRRPGEPTAPYTALYNAFAAPYNLAFLRDDRQMSEYVRDSSYQERRFCYLLGDEMGASAYVVFTDVRQEPQAKLKVEDLAFLGRRGLEALLGFLARFGADYHNIVLTLPADVDLCKLLQEPETVRREQLCGYMARVIDVPGLLRRMAKPAGSTFTVGVNDPLLPENSGVWRVTDEAVTPADGGAELELDVRALAPLALGITPLAEALYRPDVTLHGNRETLERVFVRKPCFVADHF